MAKLGRFAADKVSLEILIKSWRFWDVPGRRVGVIVLVLRSSNGEGGVRGPEVLLPDLVRFMKFVNLLDLPDILSVRVVGVG